MVVTAAHLSVGFAWLEPGFSQIRLSSASWNKGRGVAAIRKAEGLELSGSKFRLLSKKRFISLASSPFLNGVVVDEAQIELDGSDVIEARLRRTAGGESSVV